MRAGEEFVCSHCGRDGFLRLKSVLSDWTQKREVLVCSSCGKEICELKKETAGNDGKSGSAQDKRSRELLSLFGESDFVKHEKLADAGNERRFCKDCLHRIEHPFSCRCSLLDKEVDPMGDCDSFVPRKA